jgi:hypothetical protein
MREILYTDSQNMLVPSFIVESRYYNCRTDDSTSLENYGYLSTFCTMTSCNFVDVYQRFEGICCLHFKTWGWKQRVPPQRWYQATKLQFVTSQ